MCTVTQTPLHKPMNYRIHLTSGKCVSHKHYSLHPFRLSERGCSETYTKRVKYHFLFKDYLLHTTSENAQQSPSFQSLHKISKNSKKSKRELIGFFYLHFFINMAASAISISTHAMSYYRNKSIELSLIQVFVKSMGSFTRRAGGKSLRWGRHIPQDGNRKMERGDENKRATTRSIFLGKCVKMPVWASAAYSRWIMEPQRHIQMRVINSWARGGQTEAHEAWLMKRHD